MTYPGRLMVGQPPVIEEDARSSRAPGPMARDNCDTGRQMFKTKQEALKAAPEASYVKRCERCRQWHFIVTRGRRAS